MNNSVFFSIARQTIGGGDVRWDAFTRLLIEEADVGEATGGGEFDDALFFGSLADEQEGCGGEGGPKAFGGGNQSLKAVRHAHGADVADQKAVFEVQFPSDFDRRGIEAEEIGLYAVFHNRDLGFGNLPVPNQMVFEGWGHHDDLIRAAIEEPSNRAERAMQRASFAARADCGQ